MQCFELDNNSTCYLLYVCQTGNGRNSECCFELDKSSTFWNLFTYICQTVRIKCSELEHASWRLIQVQVWWQNHCTFLSEWILVGVTHRFAQCQIFQYSKAVMICWDRSKPHLNYPYVSHDVGQLPFTLLKVGCNKFCCLYTFFFYVSWFPYVSCQQETDFFFSLGIRQNNTNF